MKWLIRCLFFCLCCYSNRTIAQATLTAGPVTVNYTTYSQLTSTQTANNQVVLSNAVAVTAQLLVRASGPFTSTTSPSNTIPLNNATAQLTAVSPSLLGLLIPSGIITLTTANQSLGTGLLSLSATTFSMQYTIAGTNLIVPPGTYETTLTFTLVNTLSLLQTAVGTCKLSLVIGTISGLALQNGGNAATISFTTPSDYINGVTLSQPNALTTFSNAPYSISVKTDAISLTSGSNFINVSNVNLLPAANPSNSLITPASVTLSLTPKTIITSTATPGTYNFNLNYSTNAGNTSFLNKPAGAYTTSLTYTLTNP